MIRWIEAEIETWNNNWVTNDTNNNFNTWEHENMSIFFTTHADTQIQRVGDIING